MEVLEGESCSFECVLSHESASDPAMWTVGGKTVGSSSRFQATRQGRKYILVVREAAPSDAGEVVFSVRSLTSKASLIVKGGQGLPDGGLSPGLRSGDPGPVPRSPGVGPHGLQKPVGVLLGPASPSCCRAPLLGATGPEAPAGCWGQFSCGSGVAFFSEL